MAGSFNPVTLGHVEAMSAARDYLMGQRPGGEGADLRGAGPSAGLPAAARFDAVLGFFCANGGRRVDAKMAEKGLPAIPEPDRRWLVNMAVSDPALAWISSVGQAECEADWALPVEEREVAVLAAVRSALPQHEVLHYRLDGADVALRWRAWEHAGPQQRFLAIGRGGSEALVEAMQAGGRGPGSEWYELGYMAVLPALSGSVAAASSTAAREALARDDVAALSAMLHPVVLEWNLRRGPYRKLGAPQRGRFVHRCGDGASSMLHRGPAADAAVLPPEQADVEVADGEELRLAAVSAGGDLGLVVRPASAVAAGASPASAADGEAPPQDRAGWLPLRCLRALPGLTLATCCSPAAAAARDFVAADDGVAKLASARAMRAAAAGATVELLNPDAPGTWHFFAVKLADRPKVRGWLAVEDLLLAR